jgi:hypothetical protein
MGKTIFAAVIAAVLASVATTLVMSSFLAERSAAEAKARADAEATTQVERARIERRIADLEKRTAAAARPSRRPADTQPAASAPGDPSAAQAAPDADPGAPPAPPAPLAPDGSPYVSRKELDAALGGAGHGRGTGIQIEATPAPPEAKTLEDIARDMNLSAGEEANLREVLRESETELALSLFGDRPIEQIALDVRAAKDDPDKQAELVQGVADNAIKNLGKLATLENRTKKKVENLLGKERAADFLKRPRKPVLAADFEEFFKDW